MINTSAGNVSTRSTRRSRDLALRGRSSVHLRYRPFARKTPEQVDQNLERPGHLAAPFLDLRYLTFAVYQVGAQSVAALQARPRWRSFGIFRWGWGFSTSQDCNGDIALVAYFASSWTPAMVRRWHADPFGFLHPWTRCLAHGERPTRHAPRDGHRRDHLPHGVRQIAEQVRLRLLTKSACNIGSGRRDVFEFEQRRISTPGMGR